MERTAPFKDLTAKIIEACIEVHRILGPGFLESIYETALAHELDLRSIKYERQKAIPIPYKTIFAGEHRLDFLVEGKVIVELKAVKDFEDIHFATILSYMRAIKTEVGLLINFNKPRLVDGVKRFQI
ncbi:MAG: GxxExxY protein [Chloroflexi bacterium]|nr:GxxExxY protein [Chloroflexota bacterium]